MLGAAVAVDVFRRFAIENGTFVLGADGVPRAFNDREPRPVAACSAREPAEAPAAGGGRLTAGAGGAGGAAAGALFATIGAWGGGGGGAVRPAGALCGWGAGTAGGAAALPPTGFSLGMPPPKNGPASAGFGTSDCGPVALVLGATFLPASTTPPALLGADLSTVVAFLSFFPF